MSGRRCRGTNVLDPKLLRSDLPAVAANLARRGFALDVAAAAALEERRKASQIEADRLRAERNANAKAAGQAKAQGREAAPLLALGEVAGRAAQGCRKRARDGPGRALELATRTSQSLARERPRGARRDEQCRGPPLGRAAKARLRAKDHVEVGARLGLDFDAAARISGARFVVMTGQLAKLHRALIQFMLDLHVREHGYREAYVPYLVHAAALVGTGQLPKFEQDLFAVRGDPGYFLIPTAEVPVTNLVRDQILEAAALPLKFVAHTPCFRSEAGAAGKDTRGMIRQHQFEKVELVQIVRPERLL